MLTGIMMSLDMGMSACGKPEWCSAFSLKGVIEVCLKSLEMLCLRRRVLRG